MRADYIGIPDRYGYGVEGLRWSDAGDAIEHDGGTFALAGEVRVLLDGFASQRPLIHFGHILHLMVLLRRGETRRHDFGPLQRAWRAAGRPARTMGMLAARLCREVPHLPMPATLADMPIEVYFRLQLHLPSDLVKDDPPLTPEEFEACLARELSRYSYDDLLHWLRHGAAPLGTVGDEIADQFLESKPRSLAEALAEASRHDRLSGAVSQVARLVGALSLPPRRMRDPELPLGGYSDVTTRGHPEQILPTQFALEELEFLRRHAERELLYYRREEPSCRTREEVVVLLDQGARTWGRVRLALSACAFALGRVAHERKLGFRVATTGTGGRAVDPRTISSGELAQLLAGSDLSLTPALALETLLEPDAREAEKVCPPRDFVLLTHPRNVVSPDVAAAAHRLPPGCRLFSVAVTAEGDVGFAELVRGLPVPIAKFRLDLTDPQPWPPPARVVPRGSWAGDVEPIGFPFRFGIASTHERMLFAFDHEGEHLLVAAAGGILLSMSSADSTQHEMLPRPLFHSEVLTDVRQVIGVAGGFVVVASCHDWLVATHYSLEGRTCRAFEFHVTPGSRGDVEWRYLRRQHALAARIGANFSWVHLATGKRDVDYPDNLRWPALEHHHHKGRHACYLPPLDANGDGWDSPLLLFVSDEGCLILVDPSLSWQAEPFTPLANGQAALTGLTLTRGEYRQHTLAALFTRPDYKKQLGLFAGPDGRPIGTLALPFENDAFALSADGRLLAVQRGANQVQVREVQPGLSLRAATPVGRFHNNLVVELGEKTLWLSIDRTTHCLRWETGELIAHLTHELPAARKHPGRDVTRALPGRLPGFLRHDKWRFRLAAWRELIAVVSVFGEVFLFEHSGDLVCGFFTFRDALAAWMPDGACIGPESLLGRKPWPDANRRIGRALLDAWARGERTV